MKNLGLRAKLFILSGFLLTMCTITGIAGYMICEKVVANYQKIDQFNLPNIKAIMGAESSSRAMRLMLLRLTLPNTSKEFRDNALKEYQTNWDDYDRQIKDYVDGEFGPGEKELWLKLEPLIKGLHEKTDEAIAIYKSIKDEKDGEERKKYVQMVALDIPKLIPAFKNAQIDIIKYHEAAAIKNSADAQATKAMGTKLMISFVSGAIFLGFIFAYFLARSLVNTFKEITVSLTQSGNEVSSASNQVASASEELSQSVHEQASAIQETASSLEELSATVRKNAETSKQAAESSRRTQDSANHGKEIVEQMIDSMGEINTSNGLIVEQINQSNQKIGDIVKVITEIGNKTKVINDIVFQTKLLSFNASVEAARAGENGKGFAVVAEEVGNLAKMSGEAANEISSMLDESIRSVTKIVQESQEKISHLMNDGKQKVEKGSSIAHECGKAFNQIYEEIALISAMSSEISGASIEQSSGVQEINRAMNQLDLTTQQNSSASQQAASSAEELSAQASVMKEAVDQLIAIVEGQHTPAQSATNVYSIPNHRHQLKQAS